MNTSMPFDEKGDSYSCFTFGCSPPVSSLIVPCVNRVEENALEPLLDKGLMYFVQKNWTRTKLDPARFWIKFLLKKTD